MSCPAIGWCFGLNCVDNCNCVYCNDPNAIKTCLDLCKQGPGVHVGVATGNIPVIGDQLAALGDLFGVLTNASTWVRVGLFLFALVFVIVGFWVIAGGNQ